MEIEKAKKFRIQHFAEHKKNNQKIVMITAYDYPTALIADAAGCDCVLVGDSLGMVALGFDSTIPVTMDMMIHHTAAVHRGLKSAFLITDMPFMASSISDENTLKNAADLIQSGGAEAVKIEGGVSSAHIVEKIVNAGIPVMGHIGLTPQSVNQLGGYRVQGRNDDSLNRLIADARAIQDAGAFAIVLEAIESHAVKAIIDSINIPTIGIGANADCDGQVIVLSDLLGLQLNGRIPKFAKQYSNAAQLCVSGLKEYCKDVRDGIFPDKSNEY